MPGWARRLLAPFSLRPLPVNGTSYGARVARILRRRAPSIVVFLVIVVLFDVVRSWSLSPVGVWTMVEMIPHAFPWAMAAATILGPVLAEATLARGVRLAVLMTLLTPALVGLAGLGIAALHSDLIPLVTKDVTFISNEAFLFRGLWVYSVAGLLFAAYCRTRERERDLLRAAQDAERARAEAQREITASRLEVLQARVEPELLFDALGDVRNAYLVDPKAADALLDDLVAYLRAALPQMRGGASTLGREAALAEAYLRVVPAGRERRLSIHVTVAPDREHDDFPPMVLLPLVHAAVDAAARAVWIEAPARVDAADATARTLVVRAACGHIPDGWSEDALHVVRETLRDYLDVAASLEVAHVDAVAVALVTWHPDARPGAEPLPVTAGAPLRPALRSARHGVVSSVEIRDSSRSA